MSTVTVVRGENPVTNNETSLSAGKKKLCDSERIVSVIAGVALTGLAFKSRGMLRSLGMLGVASGMVQRGITGNCNFGKAVACLNRAMNGGRCSHHASRRERKNILDKAGMDSFPASDPPSFTPENEPKV